MADATTIGMSASSYRYVAAADKNQVLREQIVALAQRHRRYGSGMIYLKLRQSGLVVNHKRVERLYAQENLQVRRRKRKKVAYARQLTANTVISTTDSEAQCY